MALNFGGLFRRVSNQLLGTHRTYYQLSSANFISGFAGKYNASQCLGYFNGHLTNLFGSTVGTWVGVNLPQGALITDVIVYGDNSANNWSLVRSPVSSDSSQTLASGKNNTWDKSINYPEIDNDNYTYTLNATVTNNNKLYGATIIYNLP